MHEDNKKFAKQLAFSFHEQFAHNQNHHQKMFVQVFAVLITVFAGFGYAYTGLEDESRTEGTTIDLLYASLSLSMALLSLAITLIVSMAYGFRRDQTTACLIRMNAGAMQISKNDDDNCFLFPSGYNPIGKKIGFDWMPEYHKIFYIALLLIKLILIIIVINSVDFQEYNKFFCTTASIIICSIILDIAVWCIYRKKWKKFCCGVQEHCNRNPRLSE